MRPRPGHKKTTPLITLHVITEDGEHTIIFSVMTIGASSPTAVAYQGWRHLWAHALLRMCDVVALCVHVAACSLFLVSLSLKLATGGWHGKASPCSSSSSSPSSCSTVPHAKCGKGCATPDAKRVLDSSERMTHSAPSHLTGRTLSEEASSSCSSAEPADSGSSADRPVRLVSACFARCSLGDDDIDADAFEIACRRFAQDILERIGTLGARITARETHANQDKLRAARCAAQAEGKQQPSQKSRRGESKSRQRARSLPPRFAAAALAEAMTEASAEATTEATAEATTEAGDAEQTVGGGATAVGDTEEQRRSLRALLRHEVARGLHAPGGLVADPSGAMGVLWTLRGLQVYDHWFQSVAYRGGDGASTATLLREAIDKSHGELLGFISAQSVGLACKTTTATWPQIATRLAPTSGLATEDEREWCETIRPLLTRLRAMLREYDLVDVRRLP